MIGLPLVTISARVSNSNCSRPVTVASPSGV